MRYGLGRAVAARASRASRAWVRRPRAAPARRLCSRPAPKKSRTLSARALAGRANLSKGEWEWRRKYADLVFQRDFEVADRLFQAFRPHVSTDLFTLVLAELGRFEAGSPHNQVDTVFRYVMDAHGTREAARALKPITYAVAAHQLARCNRVDEVVRVFDRVCALFGSPPDAPGGRGRKRPVSYFGDDDGGDDAPASHPPSAAGPLSAPDEERLHAAVVQMMRQLATQARENKAVTAVLHMFHRSGTHLRLRRGVSMFEAVVQCLCDKAHYNKAWHVLRIMSESGVSPGGEDFFLPLFEGQVPRSSATAAEGATGGKVGRVLRLMRRDFGIVPAGAALAAAEASANRTGNAVAMRLCMALREARTDDEADAALGLAPRRPEPASVSPGPDAPAAVSGSSNNLADYNRVLQTVAARARPDEALEVLGRMVEAGVEPDRASMHMLLAAFAGAGEWESAEETYRTVAASEVGATPDTVALLWRRMLAAGERARMRAMYESGEVAPRLLRADAFAALMGANRDEGRDADNWPLLERMEELGVAHSQETCALALRTLALPDRGLPEPASAAERRAQDHRVFRLTEAMRRERVSPLAADHESWNPRVDGLPAESRSRSVRPRQ